MVVPYTMVGNLPMVRGILDNHTVVVAIGSGIHRW